MPRTRRLCVLFSVLACLLLPTTPPRTAQAAPPPDREVEDLLAAMSLEDKVGQLLCVFFNGPTVSGETRAMIRERRVGGTILYASAGNIESNAQTAALTAALQAEAATTPAGVGLFVAVDQEGGPVARFVNDFTVFPAAMALSATARPDNARMAARITGLELAALGVNVNFAPVADVNVNPKNPIIGTRSFGQNPETVARFAAAAVRGCLEAGIVCTPKHFPGHGDTSVDSHLGLPLAGHDAAALETVDFPPFRAAFAAGAEAVMTAHVELPAVDPTPGTPATLSRRVLTDLLREDMGFAGLIFTDSLGMGALTRSRPPEQAALEAFQAGADVLLFGADAGATVAQQRRAFDRLLQAARSGEISAERLDASVRRILTVKRRHGLLRAAALAGPAPDAAALARRVGTPAHLEQARRMARASVTPLKSAAGALPLDPARPTLVIRPRQGRPAKDAAAEAALAGWPNIQLRAVSGDPGPGEIQAAVQGLDQFGAVVLLTRDAWRRPGQAELAATLAAKAPGRLLAAATGAPYDLAALPAVGTVLCVYDDLPISLDALGGVLFGTRRATGRSPVGP